MYIMCESNRITSKHSNKRRIIGSSDIVMLKINVFIDDLDRCKNNTVDVIQLDL